MSEDCYSDLADRYDLMKADNPERQDFFCELFRRHNVKSVLDCACGTGLDLLLFHSLGCDVCGSDLSDSMLAQAHAKISPDNLPIPITKADFRDLPSHFNRTFDAIACLSNSINEVLDDNEAVKALSCMRKMLSNSGILVIDQGQTDSSMKNPPRIVTIVNEHDFSRLFVMDYFDDVMDVNIVDLVHTADKAEFHRSCVRIRIRLQDDWTRNLAEAGFGRLDFFGSWKGESYDRQNSKRLIIVAGK